MPTVSVDPAQIIQVYRNLHKGCWSIRDQKTGRVIAHKDRMVVKDPVFRVRSAGRAKVLATKQKNIHAYVQGKWWEDKENDIFPLNTTLQVGYNPYKVDSFCLTDIFGQPMPEYPFHKGKVAYFTEVGKVFVRFGTYEYSYPGGSERT